jgi:transcriptional regulator with XRE-family HTH domain
MGLSAIKLSLVEEVPGVKNQEIKHTIGVQIRRIRKSKGLTQEQLAERAGITYKYLGLIERGKTNPSIDTMLGIAGGLNTSMDKVFQTDTGKQPSGKKGAYNAPEEGHPQFIVNDRTGKYVPRDISKQKLIVQAIKLFKKAFTED